MFTIDRPRWLTRSPLSIDTDPASDHQGSNSSDRSTWVTPNNCRCSNGESSMDAAGHNNRGDSDGKKKQNNNSKEANDLENSGAGEHVLLAATGLDCSGCGKQLESMLNGIPGVVNVRVNFVAGQADFDLVSNNPGIDVDEVIRRVERATSFKLSRIGSQDTYIDVWMDKQVVDKVAATQTPAGVIRITSLSRKIARIAYDPHVIGARTLICSPTPVGLGRWIDGLAPLDRSDPVAKASKWRMWVMLFKTVFAAVFTIPVAVFAWAETPSDMALRGILSLSLATPVQALAVQEFYIPAISALIYSRRVEMDTLVVLSITAAYVYSVVAVIFTMQRKPLETTEFFETSTLLITLVLLGRLVAAFARMTAVSSVSTRTLQPTRATIREDGRFKAIDVRLLQHDDVFLVRPHMKVPTDGLVMDGVSEVDESMITGETFPVRKCKKMQVIAGTINGEGSLLVQLTRLPGRNTVTDIAGLVEEASSQKPKVQDLADRVAGWFVPVVLAIAVIVLVVWLGISFGVRHEHLGAGVGKSMTYAIAVLAISCPCALGLAVPMVLVVAGGVAARAGVVIKSSESVARMHKVTDVVFDKTGTITTGRLHVELEEMSWLGSHMAPSREAACITKALVQDNKHPVSVAVSKYLGDKAADEDVKNIRSIPGCGIEGTLKKSTVRAGSAHWTGVEEVDLIAGLIDDGYTTLCVTRDDKLLVVYGLKCSPRPEAKAVIKELYKRGIDVHMVSGDEEMAVDEIARKVGIPSYCCLARQSPLGKKEYVEELQTTPIPGTKIPKIKDKKTGQKIPQPHLRPVNRTILFCGDGTNDAVAIARADIGVQCGSSSDLTRATADVVLLGSNLDALMYLMGISRAARWRIIINFIWSALYNVFAILLAGGAFMKLHVRVEPAYAGLGELVSVLPVVFVAMTLGIRARLRGRRVRKRDKDWGPYPILD